MTSKKNNFEITEFKNFREEKEKKACLMLLSNLTKVCVCVSWPALNSAPLAFQIDNI